MAALIGRCITPSSMQLLLGGGAENNAREIDGHENAKHASSG